MNDDDDAVERDDVRGALERAHGNVTRAAETLGISGHALARLMKKHALK